MNLITLGLGNTSSTGNTWGSSVNK
jgi:hypothetical protein